MSTEEVDEKWHWHDFRAAMQEHASSHELQMKTLLSLVTDLDAAVSAILDRPLSYAYDRPQDFVTAVLSVRSFRLGVSSIALSLSGYPDSSPNLLRTIQEIGLWLLLIRDDPVRASLAFLLSGVRQEIEIVEHHLQQANKRGEEPNNLPLNLHRLREYRTTLETIILTHNLSVDEVLNQYGKLSPSKLSKDYGLSLWYKTAYAFQSGHVHERGFATHSFLDESDPSVRRFNLGPSCSDCDAAAYDALVSLTDVLRLAASIVQDTKLKLKCDDISKQLTQNWLEAHGA